MTASPWSQFLSQFLGLGCAKNGFKDLPNMNEYLFVIVLFCHQILLVSTATAALGTRTPIFYLAHHILQEGLHQQEVYIYIGILVYIRIIGIYWYILLYIFYLAHHILQEVLHQQEVLEMMIMLAGADG